MSDAPLVTLFVMAYAQEDVIAEAIEGAFAQTHSPLEIVLSDDCSPDGTFRVMEEMAAAYDGPHRVILNRNPENLGITGHIDRIMELASGAFVVQAAGDDVPAPDRVARLVAPWLADPSVKLVHSAVQGIDAQGRPGEIQRPRLTGEEDGGLTPLGFLRRDANVIGAAQGWDRALFDRFGPLAPLALLEDRPLPFRALLLGRIAWVDAPLLRYREGGLSDLAADRGDPWAFLYGRRLRYYRWHASCARRHLADMEIVPPPPQEAAEACALCEARAARYGLLVEIADASRARRLALLPRAWVMSRAEGSSLLLKDALRYLFDRPWAWAARRRHARRAARPEAAR